MNYELEYVQKEMKWKEWNSSDYQVPKSSGRVGIPNEHEAESEGDHQEQTLAEIDTLAYRSEQLPRF